MSPDTSLSFTGRIRSVKYALRGIRVMVASQHNAWIHAAASVVVVGEAASGGMLVWQTRAGAEVSPVSFTANSS